MLKIHRFIIWICKHFNHEEILKIIDELDSGLHAVLDLFGHGDWSVPKLFAEEVYDTVQQDEAVITYGTHFCQPFGMFHGNIEHIPVEGPGPFSIEVEYHLVDNTEIRQSETDKFSEHFIVVARNIIHLNATTYPVHQMLYDLHMRFGPVSL
mgnify:CR=1 FL=1